MRPLFCAGRLGRIVLIALLALTVAWAQPGGSGPNPQEPLDTPAEDALTDEDVGPPPDIQPELPQNTGDLLGDNVQALLGRVIQEYAPPTPGAVVKAIFGFVVLLCLAYVASRPGVQNIERQLGIAHLVTTGLPFLLLGLVASQPGVGILTPAIVREVGPLLTFGLGWIGFVIGFRFNADLMENLPPGAGSVVSFTTLIPFLVVTVTCSLMMLGVVAAAPDRALLRDALILGTAGAMTARSAPFLWKDRGFTRSDFERMARLIELERIVGVIGLMIVAAYFRPQGDQVGWQLPGTAWLVITLGIGTLVGGMIVAILGATQRASESVVLLLGSISFAAGLASFLRLSAISVCFLAGVILVNFPGSWKGSIGGILDRLERPIYFLFLTIAGALWSPGDWRGWALMVLFVCARLGGKWLGATLLAKKKDYPSICQEREWLIFAPAGAISLAIVINAQDLYSGPRLSWIVTAVIAGSVLAEILVQIVVRRQRPTL